MSTRDPLPTLVTVLLLAGGCAGSMEVPVSVTRGEAVGLPEEAAEEPVGKTAWGPLNWGMNEEQARQALEASAIPFEPRKVKKNYYLRIYPEGFENGAVYFAGQPSALYQVSLSSRRCDTDEDAMGVLELLKSEHGRPMRQNGEQEYTWRNDSITLTATLHWSDGRYHVTESWKEGGRHGPDTARGSFTETEGPAGLAIGMSLSDAQNALTDAGLPVGDVEEALVPANTTNAPAMYDPTTRIDRNLRLVHDRWEWTIGFNETGGLREIVLAGPPVSDSEGDLLMKKRTEKYGQASGEERRLEYYWEGEDAKTDLVVFFGSEDESWSYTIGYHRR